MRELIFKGATRPPMVMGVPLPIFIALGMGGLLLMVWSGLLVSKWLAVGEFLAIVALLVTARVVSKRDDQRLRQLWLSLKLWAACGNQRLWKCRSYTPHAFRNARDGYYH